MTQRIWTDRSRIETAQECGRRRWLQYHENGVGIVPVRTALPLAVGGATHAGIAVLLRNSMGEGTGRTVHAGTEAENYAVAAALAEFRLRTGEGLSLDADEEAALAAPASAPTISAPASPESLLNELEASLGMPITVGDPSPSWTPPDPAARRSAFDAYLAKEQASLVEALVRAFARHKLRPLLEEFEVLEVEREGEWELAHDLHIAPFVNVDLWFMSRPDALLLSRADRQLYLYSLKTASGLDARRRRDAERDMQGLSEGIEIERRLAEWWDRVRHYTPPWAWQSDPYLAGINKTTFNFLRELPTPPRILAVRYDFLLKGERWQDRDLAVALGMPAGKSDNLPRVQRSHLIRAYECTSTPQKGTSAFAIGDLNWSYDFTRPEDMRDSKLSWQNWRSVPVWEKPGGIKAWIDKLDTASPLMSPGDAAMGIEPQELGYRCDAQKLGVTREHPFNAVFPPPVMVFRSDDSLRDLVETIEWQERQAAEHVAEVRAATDEGEKRSLLNRYFPMHLRSCSWPTECWAVKICHGGEDIRAHPLESGLFRVRTPNHPQELSDAATANDPGRETP